MSVPVSEHRTELKHPAAYSKLHTHDVHVIQVGDVYSAVHASQQYAAIPGIGWGT